MRRFILLLGLLILLLSAGVVTLAQDDDNLIVHSVTYGDTLYRISLRYSASLVAIAEENNIENPNLIFVGQKLRIPGTVANPPTPVPPTPSPHTPTPPTPTPTPDDGGSGDTVTYIVQRGDTLGGIARRFNTTVSSLAALNGITNINLIFPGQELIISGTVPPDDGGNDGGNPPPPVVTSFQLGGHVTSINYPAGSAMRQTGMEWSKRQIVWSRGTPASAFQAEIDAAHSRGFKVLLSVVGNPAEMGSNPTQYYSEFAQMLGGLAGGGADAIEVWNEPNLPREWTSGQIGGGRYTQMLIQAYQAIKAQNSATLVVSAAPAPTGGLNNTATGGYNDDAFISAMAQAGAANYMDCVGIHYNAGTVSPLASSGAPVGSNTHYSWYYPTMVTLYRNTFPGKPLCFTEIGYLSGEGFTEDIPAGFSWAAGNTVQEQALWLQQAAVRARDSGLVNLFIIWNVDATGAFGDDPQAGYAIVRPNGSCPACNTLAVYFGG